MPATSIAPDPHRLSRLVSLGYEAPVCFGHAPGRDDRTREKEAWNLFAREAARTFDCQVAMVEHYAPDRLERSFIAAGGLDGFGEAFSQARSAKAEDHYLKGMLDRPAGAVQLGTELVAPDEMRRSRPYSTLAMPWHLEHFLMGTILAGDGGTAFFALGRTAREKPFVPGDKALVGRLLLSHLTRSMVTRREVAAVRGANAVLASVMYQAPTGLVIFDGRGKPVFINEKASRILAADDGLALVNGELRAESAIAQAQLSLGLAAMLQVTLGRPVPAPPTVLVARRASPQPYRVSFSALSPLGEGSDFPRGSAVVAVIHDERRASGATVPALFRATYGLTHAEVRLCEALLAGQSLAEVATSLDVSRNTAKTHLARVFDKTGVRSQMALLRLLTLGARA
ncbi:MAG: helix-turn-helix transcriptional regulator [Chromatiales bacterium]|nr:helix-turn-helix transcriptional regulator [Chromatiales bacterium]